MEETIKIVIPKGYEFAGVDDNAQQVVFERIKPHHYPKTFVECSMKIIPNLQGLIMKQSKNLFLKQWRNDYGILDSKR